ncbi:MAG: helix-turn-helix domain-containing protein [Proteobacteria bacterium]|nr:helix-turn-helix domain-containing protein [Pseudomonadota bacterium]
MSEEDETQNNPSSESEAKAPLGGERLAEARRKLQIPLLEIAKELHLDEYKVSALECNDFDVLGAPVFAKGHLRKFAQLVDVDEKDVMADYYQLSRSTAPPPLVPTRARPREPFSPAPWLVAGVAILIAASGYWWFSSGENEQVPVVTGELTALPADIATSEPEEEIPASGDDTSTKESQVIPQPEAAPESNQSPVFQMSVTYSGDCWTEITDANGRRLFFAMGTAGRTVTVSGEAPFNVLFGNVANVSITVNGEAFNIPAANRRGQTARLTITGP